MGKRDLILHTCCAPCMGYVFEALGDYFRITSFFYNPNIAPAPEYLKRLAELKGFSRLKDFELVEGDYDLKAWTARVKPYRSLGERSQRCRECYRYRLEETFRLAARRGVGIVTTTLSVSPYKDASMINGIGKELEKQYQIEFLEADFKKQDGYRKSMELSRVYGFYRQNYCGCAYSRMEREKKAHGHRAEAAK